ncbi:MAG: AsmA family protein [Hyphomicrobium sp.]|nr:AsmA family protein [Hyphomicrobium sp.]
MTDRQPPRQSPPSLGGYRPGNDRGDDRPVQGTRPHAPAAAPPPLPQRAQANALRAAERRTSSGPAQRGPAPPPPPHRPGGGRPPAPPSGGRGGGLGWLLGIGLALFGLAAAGAAILFLAMPTDYIRDRIVAEVKERTGRNLTIAGPTSFKFYPSLGLSMGGVTLSLPAGMTGEPFVTMKSLEASVALLPLIGRKVEIQSLVLGEPVIRLAIDGEGRKSWDFAPPGARSDTGTPVRYAQAADPTTASDADAIKPSQSAPSSAQQSRLTLKELSLTDVRVARGTIHYADQRSGTAEIVEAVDLAVSLPDIDAPLDAKGRATWRGEPIDIDGRLNSLRSTIDSNSANLTTTISSKPLTARYDGELAFGGSGDADGDLELSGPSIAGLAAWMSGGSIAKGGAQGGVLPFDVKGRVRSSASTYMLTGATIALDKARATGDVAVTTGAERPIVKANLKFADLDLDRLLAAAPVVDGESSKPKAAPQKAPEAAPGAAPQSIDDLLKNDGSAPSGPRVQGFVARAGLSDAAIDWSPLFTADVGAAITADRITAKGLAIDKANLDVALSAGVLKLTVRELAGLGGRAQGFVSVDPSPRTKAAVGTNLTFDGVGLAPLLKLSGVQDISGQARLGGKIAMAGQGGSVRQIAESLSGDTTITIANGNLRYRTASAEHAIDAIDMAMSGTSLSGPLAAKGALAWNGERIAIDANLATLSALADARPVTLVASVNGAPVTASYNGTLSYSGGLAADGAVALKTRSLRTLASWLGTDLPEGPGFGPLDLSGKLTHGATSSALTGAKIALDGDTATGDVSVNTSAARPKVTARLKLTGLDLNKYLADLSAPPVRKAPATTSSTAKPAAGPTAGKEPQVRGYTQRTGWSEEPMDVSVLSLADVDAKLSIGRLVYKKIKVGQSNVSVGLKSSVLKTSFDDVALYGGKGKGIISVDATAPKTPKVATNLDFNGVQALPFLKDAADLDWLDGKSRVAVDVKGQGGTQRQIMDALAGTAQMNFTDGAIVGINIPAMIRSAGQGNLGGAKNAPTEKTDFSSLTSNWKVAGGVAQNNDLQLLSPLLRVTGSGKVELGKRRVDYLLKPKVVASLTGQGGQTGLEGLEIPLKVEGPWEKPSFVPDFKSILSDPNKAIDKIKEIGKQFQGKKPEDILKGILGGGQPQQQQAAPPAQGATSVPPASGTAPAPAPAPPPKKSKTEEMLEKLLNP